MAEDLGKRLLGEVEVIGVGEILNLLCLQDTASAPPPPFGFPPLDRLLQAINEGRQLTSRIPPVVELTSLHTGGGVTHLLYHLTALAVLPRERGGSQSCAVIVDTDGRFDVDRLVAQIRTLLSQRDESDNSNCSDETILQALRHVHIFRPQFLASLTATLHALPSYLFNQQRHFSFDRSVCFVAIDSALAFYWQDRAETENAAFYAKTSGEPGGSIPQTGYVDLTTVLKKTCTTLQCSAIFTSGHLGPSSTTSHTARSFKPSLPAPLSTLPTLRLVCQRISVKKLPPMISVEGAMREANDRLKAVEEGKFECFVNEWGVDDRTLRRMHGVGSGFEFRVSDDGVVVES